MGFTLCVSRKGFYELGSDFKWEWIGAKFFGYGTSNENACSYKYLKSINKLPPEDSDSHHFWKEVRTSAVELTNDEFKTFINYLSKDMQEDLWFSKILTTIEKGDDYILAEDAHIKDIINSKENVIIA